ncbi:pantoate--beta-alanine ligase [Desulfopila aestuarii]|uniref:Pantothenate synthetase n=1 Tax=Desulfopila aestuarii DSM 18488 TaxID=1121416 RepID=A0A1M7YBY9_9BACT|nr:pantoate--beta-alanine ligase [Desulfopila aestuarii]SHO50111.1 pantothenate synthetase [Desulfopila aestuarii DSM 18488]
MKIVEDQKVLQRQVDDWRRQGLKIGLVPTMGFFHEGHLALMRKAASCCDKVITSLFVNPMQFGPNEDLDAYPRNFERDRSLAEQESVDVLFCPDTTQMYGENFQTRVMVEKLSKGLCAASRPGHFDGVATVVTKLFLAAKPHVAVFGQKDFQQLAIIRQMVEDLNFDVEIIGHPIVRESDGLAMSSRNKYLNEQERKIAVCLYESICKAKQMFGKMGDLLTSAEVENMVKSHIEQHPECRVDYASVVHKTTLQHVENCNENSMLILAVKVSNKVRLIDNSPLQESI